MNQNIISFMQNIDIAHTVRKQIILYHKMSDHWKTWHIEIVSVINATIAMQAHKMQVTVENNNNTQIFMLP